MTILGLSEELVSRCVECDLAEPESLTSLGGSATGVVDGILSRSCFLAYSAHVTGSSAAIKERGSSGISPVSHSTMTLYLLPL